MLDILLSVGTSYNDEDDVRLDFHCLPQASCRHTRKFPSKTGARSVSRVNSMPGI